MSETRSKTSLARQLVAIARRRESVAILAAQPDRRAVRATRVPPAFRCGLDAVESWFASRGWTPWPFQREAWRADRAGRSGLIHVSTGAGKTYAAFGGPLAAIIDELATTPSARVDGLRVLYVTPLRAVSRDVEFALRAPIEDLGFSITVESRTGDTKQSVRTRQRQRLPNVLVTTPESLTLLLTRENSEELFSTLHAVIVDEWHELVSTKRGSQMELALARLRRLAPGLRSWGMSATLPNLEEAARALVGLDPGGGPISPLLIRGEMPRPILVDSILPDAESLLPWAGHLGLSMLPGVLKSLDPSVSTILFANTRSQAERWFHAIAVCRPQWEPRMALHHGSLEREDRERVEAGLKSGELTIVVATSSLDLGVDFGPVERVFQIGSPKGVSRVAQRAGRASHRPRAACRITCVPTHALELIEIAAARDALERGEIEERRAIPKPLDVLSQHLVSCALAGGFIDDELFREIRTAWSYRDLTREEFDWAIRLVRDGGEALGAYPDYHRIRLEAGRYRVPTPRLAALHRLNVGTITGDLSVEIRYVGSYGKNLGRIDENFVAGLREGDKFVFAGKVLRFAGLRDCVAFVRPASGRTNYTPIWGGTRLPISESLAESIRVTLGRAARAEISGPEIDAAQALIDTQRRISHIPGPDETLAEILHTREGAHLFIFPFEGRLVHGGLAALLALRLGRRRHATFSVAANDYGLELVCPEDFPYEQALTPDLFDRSALIEDALESVNLGQLAKLQFREVARVANLVFQNHPGSRRTGKQSQVSAGLLFDVLSEFDPGNLLLHQSTREVLDRHYEQSRLVRTLDRLHAGPLRIVRTDHPTPLGFPLMIERLVGRLSSESIADRVSRIQNAWTRAAQQADPNPQRPASPPAPFDFVWEPPPAQPQRPAARTPRRRSGPGPWRRPRL